MDIVYQIDKRIPYPLQQKLDMFSPRRSKDIILFRRADGDDRTFIEGLFNEYHIGFEVTLEIPSIIINRIRNTGLNIVPKDQKLLRKLFAWNADIPKQIEIAQQLVDECGIKNYMFKGRQYIKDGIVITSSFGPKNRQWLPDEIGKLEGLIAAGYTNKQLMKKFPDRTYGAIRTMRSKIFKKSK